MTPAERILLAIGQAQGIRFTPEAPVFPMRVGQLIANALSYGEPLGDLYYVEDHVLADRLETYVREVLS